MAQPQVIAADGQGRAVALDATSLDHLRVALRGHLGQLHRAGIAAPRALVELAVAVSAGGRSGRVAGREFGDAPSPVQTRLMTYAEAAEYLGVSTRTLRRYRAQGRIRGVGRRLVVEVPLE